MKILGSRNFSEGEMLKRLVSKGEPEDAAKAAVRWLVELGYINDDGYAKLIVNHYAAKGYGEARIRDELHRRSIPRELWDAHLAEYRASATEDPQTAPAVEYLSKKLRGSTDEHDLRRARNALVRRGFSYDEAKEAINLYLDTINNENG